MKIGIIVYSQTGNTMSVAEKLEQKLSGSGHAVKLERITVKGEPKPGEKEIAYENKPAADPYDVIVFASPVQAFSLCVVMKDYLKGIDSLKGKKVHFFVTKAMSMKWSGGNCAIKTMKKLASAKGAEIGEAGIIFWKEKHRGKMMKDIFDRISDSI